MQIFKKTILASVISASPLMLYANQIELGDNATAFNQQAIAIGQDAAAKSGDSIAIGHEAIAQGGVFVSSLTGEKYYPATAVGAAAQATSDYATAVGANSRATAQSATALGRQAMADAEGSVAIGWGAIAREVGDSTSAKNAVALGKQAKAENDNATALGASSTAHGRVSVALGNFAGAYQEGSVAIGADAKSHVKGSIAIGQNAMVQVKDIKAAGVTSYLSDIANQDARFGVVSFGQKSTRFNVPDTTRRLTFVAGGIDDTDAANIAQLKVLDGKISGLKNQIDDVLLGHTSSSQSTALQSQLDDYQQELQNLKTQYSTLADTLEHSDATDLSTQAKLHEQNVAIEQTQQQLSQIEDTVTAQSETLAVQGQELTQHRSAIFDLQDTMAHYMPALEQNVADLNQRVDRLNTQVAQNRRRADAGVAGAIAIASLPQPSALGRTSVGMAMGFSGGESAVSMGAVHQFMQGQASVKIGTAFNSQDKPSGGVGFGWTFN